MQLRRHVCACDNSEYGNLAKCGVAVLIVGVPQILGSEAVVDGVVVHTKDV